MKQLIKLFTPPIILLVYKKIFKSRYGWQGDYSTWRKAQKASMGYDSDKILQTVKHSLLKVKNGEAVYERDSVLFDEVQYNWPLLSGLMYAAAKSNGRLYVMDFGGSLGSTYFQNKKFLDNLHDVKWTIVEQAHFVETGKQSFETDVLKFYADIDSCVEEVKPNVLLLSSVLQYIEKPYELLEKLLNYKFDLIIVDRTPFVHQGGDTIKLQYVDPSIYDASYPCWFFDVQGFIKYFNKKSWLIKEEYHDPYGELTFLKSYILEKAR